MMKKEEYINEVTALIKNKAVRNDVRKELEAHIDDRAEYYLNAGYDEDVSVKRAVEMMGSPKEVAESLEKLHNNTLWIIISAVSLFVYIIGLICANFNPAFAYVNLVDFSETDARVSMISIITFCAATVSLCFAVKAKSIAALRMYGIISVISPLLSFYALRPAGYHFISVFTDFPASLKIGEALFGNEAFSLFFERLGISSSILWIFLIISVLAVASLHIVTGILSLVYARKLKHEENCGNFENVLQRFAVFLIAVCAVTVVGTGAEFAHDTDMAIKSYQDYNLHKDEYYTEAKEIFDSIDIPVSKEDALLLANQYQDEYQIDYSYIIEHFYFLEIYNCYGQTISLYDYDKNGIYEAKQFFNDNAYNKGIKKESLKNLKIGSSIEELYNIADFSRFVTYNVRESDNETHIEIRICDKLSNEYWLNYTNGKLVSSTVQ